MVGAPKVAENIMTDWLGLPPLASTHGGQIDGMIGWVHVFMLILFVGWGGFFAYCLVRFRRARHPVANYAGVKSHTSSYLEVGVAVVEAILLFGFAIPLWAARVDRMPPANEALVVQVTAEQFAWNVHYPGPDGVFGRTDLKLLDLQANPLGLDRSDPAAKDDVTTLNQLYLPVNKPIIVRLRSKDMIHSFGVPEFRVKQDAIPGLTIPLWFVPNVTTAEMRTRTGNAEFQYRDCLRAALRSWPLPDAGICHRPDRRGVPEVAGGKDQGTVRGLVGPVQVSSVSAPAARATRTSSASAFAPGFSPALRR